MPVNNRRYTLDYTGVDPNNLILKEKHSIRPNGNDKAVIVPFNGCFFREGLTIIDLSTGLHLVEKIDYDLALPLSEINVLTGKDVFEGLIINVIGYSKDIEITYQCLGGGYEFLTNNLLDFYERAKGLNGSVDWDSIVNKPTRFTPTEHTHILSDVVGFGPIVHMLERITKAIHLSHSPMIDQILTLIETNRNDISELDRIMAIIRTEIAAALNSGVVGSVNSLKQQLIALTKKVSNIALEFAMIANDMTLLNTKVDGFSTKLIALEKLIKDNTKEFENHIRSDRDDSTIGHIQFNVNNKSPIGSYSNSARDSKEIMQVWSIGPGYKTAEDGLNFGNLYGLAYFHPNNKLLPGSDKHGELAGGHQVVHVHGGEPMVAMGKKGIWTKHGVNITGRVSEAPFLNRQWSHTIKMSPDLNNMISNSKVAVVLHNSSGIYFVNEVAEKDFGRFSTVDNKLHLEHGLHSKGTVSIGGTNTLFFNTHGGGWNMLDDTWMRLYGNKKLLVYATANNSIATSGGVDAAKGFYWNGTSLDERYLKMVNVIHTFNREITDPKKIAGADSVYRLYKHFTRGFNTAYTKFLRRDKDDTTVGNVEFSLFNKSPVTAFSSRKDITKYYQGYAMHNTKSIAEDGTGLKDGWGSVYKFANIEQLWEGWKTLYPIDRNRLQQGVIQDIVNEVDDFVNRREDFGQLQIKDGKALSFMGENIWSNKHIAARENIYGYKLIACHVVKAPTGEFRDFVKITSPNGEVIAPRVRTAKVIDMESLITEDGKECYTPSRKGTLALLEDLKDLKAELLTLMDAKIAAQWPKMQEWMKNYADVTLRAQLKADIIKYIHDYIDTHGYLNPIGNPLKQANVTADIKYQIVRNTLPAGTVIATFKIENENNENVNDQYQWRIENGSQFIRLRKGSVASGLWEVTLFNDLSPSDAPFFYSIEMRSEVPKIYPHTDTGIIDVTPSQSSGVVGKQLPLNFRNQKTIFTQAIPIGTMLAEVRVFERDGVTNVTNQYDPLIQQGDVTIDVNPTYWLVKNTLPYVTKGNVSLEYAIGASSKDVSVYANIPPVTRSVSINIPYPNLKANFTSSNIVLYSDTTSHEVGTYNPTDSTDINPNLKYVVVGTGFSMTGNKLFYSGKDVDGYMSFTTNITNANTGATTVHTNSVFIKKPAVIYNALANLEIIDQCGGTVSINSRDPAGNTLVATANTYDLDEPTEPIIYTTSTSGFVMRNNDLYHIGTSGGTKYVTIKAKCGKTGNSKTGTYTLRVNVKKGELAQLRIVDHTGGEAYVKGNDVHNNLVASLHTYDIQFPDAVITYFSTNPELAVVENNLYFVGTTVKGFSLRNLTTKITARSDKSSVDVTGNYSVKIKEEVVTTPNPGGGGTLPPGGDPYEPILGKSIGTVSVDCSTAGGGSIPIDAANCLGGVFEFDPGDEATMPRVSATSGVVQRYDYPAGTDMYKNNSYGSSNFRNYETGGLLPFAGANAYWGQEGASVFEKVLNLKGAVAPIANKLADPNRFTVVINVAKTNLVLVRYKRRLTSLKPTAQPGGYYEPDGTNSLPTETYKFPEETKQLKLGVNTTSTYFDLVAISKLPQSNPNYSTISKLGRDIYVAYNFYKNSKTVNVGTETITVLTKAPDNFTIAVNIHKNDDNGKFPNDPASHTAYVHSLMNDANVGVYDYAYKLKGTIHFDVYNAIS